MLKLNAAQKAFWQKYSKQNIREPKDFKTKVQIGHIYMFAYSATTVNYWDSYPLSLIIHRYNDGFLGLSLHYLPPKMREFFIKKILIGNYQSLKKGGPANVSYGDIKDANNLFYREGITIIRRYLAVNIKSKIAEIPYTEWINIATGAGDGQWINTTAALIWEKIKTKLRKIMTGSKGVKSIVPKNIKREKERTMSYKPPTPSSVIKGKTYRKKR